MMNIVVPSQGPPPDPVYNFLADKRRESSNLEAKEAARKESRRHPKNFGGQDFGNVPAQMRERKERQVRCIYLHEN